MKNEISISETEWKVMEVLWAGEPMNIGDIREALKTTGWSNSTIKTLVRRLCQKRAIEADDSKGQFSYKTLVGENECRLKETKNLIERVYHGSVKMLMANLVSDSNLTDEDAKKLMDIISKMEEE